MLPLQDSCSTFSKHQRIYQAEKSHRELSETDTPCLPLEPTMWGSFTQSPAQKVSPHSPAQLTLPSGGGGERHSQRRQQPLVCPVKICFITCKTGT